MNKNLVIGLGGLVGLGAAVALFFATQPSSTTDVPVPEPIIDIEPVERGQASAMEVGAVKKDPEEVANPNPLAAAAMENTNADYRSFTAEAGPTWQALSIEVHNTDPELSAECRAMAMNVRKDNRNPDVDVAAKLAEQRALLERVAPLMQSEEGEASVTKLTELMVELENAE